MKTIYSLLIMCATVLTASAQVDPGWQTGGGYNAGSGTQSQGGSERRNIGSGDRSGQSYHFDITDNQKNAYKPAYGAGSYRHTRSYGYLDLFDGGHDDLPYAFTLGYVNKFWNTDFGGYTWHENFWGEEGKRLHGLQLGFTYQPCLPIGLGLRTGVMWEIYFSVSPAVQELGWDDFTEHSLYIPLHAQWRIPFDRECSLSLFGGLGMNWAMVGTYNDEHYQCTDYAYADYGRGEWPKHLNFATEIGASVRIKKTQLSFTYSKGMTDHGFYRQDGNFKTTQDKIGLSLSFLFDD